MAGKTKISWTDKTNGPVRGCSRTCAAGTNVSGCGDGTGGGCYAEQMAWRIVKMDRARGVPEGNGKYDGLVRPTANGPRWTGVVRMDEDGLREIITSRPRTPQRRFLNSMSDIFHDNFPDHQLDRLWAALLINARHERGGMVTYQILTKRSSRMLRYLSDPATLGRVAAAAGTLMEDGDGWHDQIAFDPRGLADDHIHLGVSAEHQEAADERIPDLLSTPAAVRFVSAEPLLDELSLWVFLKSPLRDESLAKLGVTGPMPGLSWVIVGCESGDGARPARAEWFRILRDQCVAARVPFFLKQAAELHVPEPDEDPRVVGYPSYADHMHAMNNPPPTVTFGDGSRPKRRGIIELPYLDGVQWAQHVGDPLT